MKVKRYILKKYNLTQDAFDRMLIDQGGICPICTVSISGETERPVVDHCHRTGMVRGLLCSRCNSSIGFLKDNAVSSVNAALYLNRFTGNFREIAIDGNPVSVAIATVNPNVKVARKPGKKPGKKLRVPRRGRPSEIAKEDDLPKAVRLLRSGSLNGDNEIAWRMYCSGHSERKIAQALGLSRSELRLTILNPLKLSVGIPVARSEASRNADSWSPKTRPLGLVYKKQSTVTE